MAKRFSHCLALKGLSGNDVELVHLGQHSQINRQYSLSLPD
jgi:hypothetical protein